MYSGFMNDDKHRERAETEELLELPPTIENLDAKMNHIITHLYLTEHLCNRAARASEDARDLSQQAKISATNAASTAMKAIQSREPLSRVERFGTVFAGSMVGGAMASLVMSLLGLAGVGAAIASCVHP
jgi:alkyl hydroperoxide reductase subunit AhpF